MPSDTYDPFLGLILQGAGNNNNTWGDKLNDSMIKMAARGIAGLVSRNLTGGTLDLSGVPPPSTTRQDIDYIQVISGILTSMQTIIVPSIAKTWIFYNSFAGTTFPVVVKTAAGFEAMQIPSGTAKLLWCDGSRVWRTDYYDIGQITLGPGPGNLYGALACNGQSVLKSSYPNLYNRILNNFGGSGGGLNFTIPNLGTFPGNPLVSYWMRY